MELAVLMICLITICIGEIVQNQKEISGILVSSSFEYKIMRIN